MSRKNKTISFNSLDPYDLELLTHAEKPNPLTGKERNFSKYVKKLIEDDLRKERLGNQNVVMPYEVEDDISMDDIDKINSFL